MSTTLQVSPVKVETKLRSCRAVLNSPYGVPYEFTTSDLPQPTKDEALVRLDFTGVCHGDVYSRDGGGPAPQSPRRPLIGGHEGVGRIMALGDNKKFSGGFQVGDMVGIAWRFATCGECKACKLECENYCPHQQVNGMHKNGTFQQYIAFPLKELVHLPDGIDLPSACPALCAGVTAYVSLRKMKPRRGRWCVISGGAGGVGHMAIQYAKQVFGLKVLVIDGGAGGKEQFCKRKGCDEYVDFNSAGSRLSDEVRQRTGGGAHYVLILSPHQAAYDAAGEYADFQAQIMAVGIGSCCFPLRPILTKSLTIQSSQTGTKRDIEEVLRLTAKGVVTSEIEVMDMFELNHALDRMKAGGVLGKLVLDLRRPGTALSTSVQPLPASLS